MKPHKTGVPSPHDSPGSKQTFVVKSACSIDNSFRVKVRAARFATIYRSAALFALFEQIDAASAAPLFLGEATNVLFRQDYPGWVIRLANRGIRVVANEPDTMEVQVAAGENWNDFVHWSLNMGLAGLENLICIPGSVGAAPVQNIGAYGVEVGEFIDSITCWDWGQKNFVSLVRKDCEFAYRHSLFRKRPGRYLVTEVRFRLQRKRRLRLTYRGIREELERMEIIDPTPRDIGRVIARLRQRKLPDPRRIGNAGSFFKNPLVAALPAAELRRKYPGLPQYPEPAGTVKLAAAWMIEACGYRGYRQGDAGVSQQHALVLVNYGMATGAELWALAEQIREDVHERFDVILEPEPRIL